MDKLVGKGNESEVWIEGVKLKGLIDTGSMISTISKDAVKQMEPKPELHMLEELEVKCADGLSLPYLGYVEVTDELPFLQGRSLHVPLLVVAMTDYNKSVPVIVGTNIIRQCKQLNNDIEQAPEAWQMAFHAINNNQVGVVKTTSKITLQPMEVKTITGFVRKNNNVESAITEPSEQGSSAKFSVCPRIVSLITILVKHQGYQLDYLTSPQKW